MLSIVMLFLQGSVGKLLKDWRFIAAILIGVIIFIIFLKFSNMEKGLKKAKEQVVIEQQHSQVLQNNWDQALTVNKQNEVIIAQLQVDRDNATQALTSLSETIEHSSKQLTSVKARIDNISVSPSNSISPYIAEAITGIQEMRDAEQPASSPK